MAVNDTLNVFVSLFHGVTSISTPIALASSSIAPRNLFEQPSVQLGLQLANNLHLACKAPF